MKKYDILPNGLGIIFPDDWTVEMEGNIVSVYNPVNGVGALQFSIYQSFDSSDINLKEFLAEYLRDKFRNLNISEFDKYVTAESIDLENKWWKFWLFTKTKALIFASYNCSKDFILEEQFKAEKIVESLIDY